MIKKLLILIMILFFSITNAQENYNDLWEKVQRLEVENLPKSALKVVNEIYAKADKNDNAPQIVKSLFYKSKFSLILEEDAQLKIVNQFKKHINKSSFPTKNVLENVLANLYWQYFNQHRWKFYQRTKTNEKVDNIDFRTWDLDTLFEEINTYYFASLQEKGQLQKVDVYQFKDILHQVKGSKNFRPTLYDFLAHNALPFYKTSESNITKPAYQFSIDNKELIADSERFSKVKLQSKGTLSLQFNALKIYQNLIAFHLADKNPTALVDVDLQRLQFVKQHANFDDANNLFLQTLKTSEANYKNHKVSSLYTFEIAKIYNQQANSYNKETNPKPRFKNQKSLTICNSVIQQFPKSLGAKKCAVLKQQILNEQLSITTENHLPIDKYTRLLIYYKNINQLYFTAYKISFKQQEKLRKTYNEKEKIAFINTLEKSFIWNNKLRNENDYLQHTTEVIVPKMLQGNYLIIASKKNK